MATSTIKRTSNDRLILQVPANTHSTMQAAVEAIYTAYQTLTTNEKRNSYLRTRQAIYYMQHISHGQYDHTFQSGNKYLHTFVDLYDKTIKKYDISASGITFSDLASDAQSDEISLFVRAH